MAPVVKERLTYSVEIACDEDETRHWRHPWCIDNNNGECASVPSYLPEGEEATISALFDSSAKAYGGRPCMGTRTITECKIDGKKIFWSKSPFEWRSYAEVHADVQMIAKGLLGLEGVIDKRKSNSCVVGILAETSAEWQMSAQAAFKAGIPITTVYTTLGHEAMVHGLNETECQVLFCDFAQYHGLAKPVFSQCPKLQHIVLIGKCFVPVATIGGESKAWPSPAEVAEMPRVANASTTTFEVLKEVGKESSVDLKEFAAKSTDLAFIMYTSGSTGLPKGVMLTHGNFISTIAGVQAQGVLQASELEVYIAYLPLAHILELIVETTIIGAGARIGYGHARTLTSTSPYMLPTDPEGSDLVVLQPSLMVAVPAILDTIKTGLGMKMEKLEGFMGKMVRGSIRMCQKESAGEGLFVGTLLNLGLQKVVVNKVRTQIGLGNLRLIGSGGAPLSPETQSFITQVLAPVAQGYGATETTGASTIQEVVSVDGRPADERVGNVGPVQPSAELKLRSVPDMGYLVTDSPPRGEILLGGNSVSSLGYYKMEEKTAEDFPKHADGQAWFHTGDIGVMTETGALRIIDRKKDLIKLSGGEYVSLGKVEAALKQVPGIGSVVVFAQSNKDYCVCIVSETERGWKSVGGRPEEATLLKDIEAELRGQKFARFEIPTKIKIDDLVWTPENGLTTASLKVQRNPLRNHYNEPGGLLDQMDYRFT